MRFPGPDSNFATHEERGRGPTFYAHSANNDGAWHPLVDHLRMVGAMAADFAGAARWREEARLAGLLHDIGKYANRFQRRLQGKEKGLDHWSQGASLALIPQKAVAAALAIQGHHIGLQRGDTDSLRQLDAPNLAKAVLPGLDLSESDLTLLGQRASDDGLAFPQTIEPCLQNWKYAVAAMLDVRMLFSCLVDADFLDTEAHFNTVQNDAKARRVAPPLDAAAAIAALHEFMEHTIREKSAGTDDVRTMREDLWQACGDMSKSAPGLFTLTAPTGSGKTLAMLRFALEHAKEHNLRRIVIVIPFLTVLEQTAEIYRSVFCNFPDRYVLEHHSLAGLGAEHSRHDAESGASQQQRLLSQNWDAPIVLTTNVQLLESLFSNRPSACRKLHRLMQSVVIFDEAQNVPTSLAVPTLAALSSFASNYNSSVVFATATQPAFDALSNEISRHSSLGWNPKEIVTECEELFNRLDRVHIDWRNKPVEWSELATEIAMETQALVICNLKRHALALHDILQKKETDGVFHLSTNLCPGHRRDILARVRSRLEENRPCWLISTQCVEAGVDIDFPTVFRAFGPLDAVAQAAGRCNREGRLKGQGRVIIFEAKDVAEARRQYPTFAYYQAAEVTRLLWKEHGAVDLSSPAIFREYYKNLYDVAKPESLNPDLIDAINARDFAKVARHYRIIEKDTLQILVPWGDRTDQFYNLRDQAEREGISAGWMRRAQELSVSLYKPRGGMPAWAIPAKLRARNGVAAGLSDEWFILEGNFYNDTLGLVPPERDQLFIA